MHYNWHRYYDPDTGRYLTPDPIGLAGGINQFVYGENNPLFFIDPEGLSSYPGHDEQCKEWCEAQEQEFGDCYAIPTTNRSVCNCKNEDDKCSKLYDKISKRINELKKRHSDLLIDERKLPQTGPMSIEGHRQQFSNKQQNLRKLLNEANTKGCTQYNTDAWIWATIKAPYPRIY